MKKIINIVALMIVAVVLLASCSVDAMERLGRTLQAVGTVNLGYGGSVAMENLKSNISFSMSGITSTDDDLPAEDLEKIISLIISVKESSADTGEIREYVHSPGNALPEAKTVTEGTHFVELLNNASSTINDLRTELNKVEGYDSSTLSDEDEFLENLLGAMKKLESTFAAIDSITAQQNGREYISYGDYIAMQVVTNILSSGFEDILDNSDASISDIGDNVLVCIDALQVIYGVDFNLPEVLSVVGTFSGS